MFKVIEYTDMYKEKVVDLLSNIILKEFEIPEDIEFIKNYDYNFYKNSGGNFWIAVNEENDVIATTAIRKCCNEKEVELVRVYLNKEYRGTGIASQMLDVAISFAKDRKFEKIILGTYKKFERAIAFYEKHGFKEYNNEFAKNKNARYFALNI